MKGQGDSNQDGKPIESLAHQGDSLPVNQLSNIVLMPKNLGKWWMCMDFYDLNKFYPKDCYLFSRIDQLVDSSAGHELICMMGTYQYHQIPLAKADQDKIITFCHGVMPFGLKNARVIYQRLLDKIFSPYISKNVEVPVSGWHLGEVNQGGQPCLASRRHLKRLEEGIASNSTQSNAC